jgi:hypothetical protein
VNEPYRDYLLQVRKIEQLWSYPPQAIAGRRRKRGSLRSANGGLSGYR